MATRRIFFSRLAIDARIGVLEHELRSTQPIYIDVDIEVNITQAADDKDISTVLDYRKIRELIIDECTKQHIHLIEVMAERVNQRLLETFEDIVNIQLRIEKPLAFSDCAAVGIELRSERTQ